MQVVHLLHQEGVEVGVVGVLVAEVVPSLHLLPLTSPLMHPLRLKSAGAGRQVVPRTSPNRLCLLLLLHHGKLVVVVVVVKVVAHLLAAAAAGAPCCSGLQQLAPGGSCIAWQWHKPA